MAGAAHGPGLEGYWSHAGEGADGAAVALAQFGQERQQHAGGDRSIPMTMDGKVMLPVHILRERPCEDLPVNCSVSMGSLKAGDAPSSDTVSQRTTDDEGASPHSKPDAETTGPQQIRVDDIGREPRPLTRVTIDEVLLEHPERDILALARNGNDWVDIGLEPDVTPCGMLRTRGVACRQVRTTTCQERWHSPE